ncbi:translation initiation factor IF-2-like [Vidua macroura]|uniref:translation initiation factor IF-2-like n=1 Tax=Vidua macroura TaxID=187451 RepID=UPI0023A7D40C|nr:translation initiation factor IF-2-like [Vidua macroura]
MIQSNICFSYSSQHRRWGTTLTAHKLCQSRGPARSWELLLTPITRHRKDEPVPRSSRSSSPARPTLKAHVKRGCSRCQRSRDDTGKHHTAPRLQSLHATDSSHRLAGTHPQPAGPRSKRRTAPSARDARVDTCCTGTRQSRQPPSPGAGGNRGRRRPPALLHRAGRQLPLAPGTRTPATLTPAPGTDIPATATPAHPGQRRGGAGPRGARWCAGERAGAPPPAAAAVAAERGACGAGATGGLQLRAPRRRGRRWRRLLRGAPCDRAAAPGARLPAAAGRGGPRRRRCSTASPAAKRGGERRRRLPAAVAAAAGSPAAQWRPRLNLVRGSGRRDERAERGSSPPPPGGFTLRDSSARAPGDRGGSGGAGGAPRLAPTSARQRRRGGPRTALRPFWWNTSFASTFMLEWPSPVRCCMVPATGALQQCVRILPPVLVDHPDGCKSAEEI